MLTSLAALSLSSEVEKFGAYAGFAAVLGLAVLSLLYFASAREVKRLREWADRAPERVADLEARVGDLARQRAAVPQPVGKAAVAKPGAKPATVAAAGAAAKPGAKEAAANGGAKDAAKKPAAKGAAKDAAPGDGDGAAVFDVVEEAPGDLTEIKRPDGKPAAKDETLVSPGAGRALRQNKPSARPRSQPPVRPSTARLMESARASNAQRVTGGPPSAGGGSPEAPGEGRDRKRLALIGGGVVAGIIVVVILVTQVFGGGGGGTPAPKTNVVAPPTNTSTTADGGTVDRANTTVAVLNGTTFDGLARGVADKVTEGGFKRGEVRNAIDNTRAATIVGYTEGNRQAALEVARTIDVGADAVALADSGTQALAPTAQVIVTVGSDQTPTTTG